MVWDSNRVPWSNNPFQFPGQNNPNHRAPNQQSINEKLNGTESQRTPFSKLRSSYQVFVGVRSVGPVREFLELTISWVAAIEKKTLRPRNEVTEEGQVIAWKDKHPNAPFRLSIHCWICFLGAGMFDINDVSLFVRILIPFNNKKQV